MCVAMVSYFITCPDGLVFGSLQQLLSVANSGFLCSTYNDEQLFQPGVNPSIHNGSESQVNCVNLEQVSDQEFVDDGYSGGTESESDTPICAQKSHVFADTESEQASDGYVSLSDPIGQEEFLSGRDLDSCVFGLGTDDTDINVDGGDVNIGNAEKSTEHPSVNAVDIVDTITSSEDIPAFVVPDCGPSEHVIEHEISPLYVDGVKRGYFKRYCFWNVVSFC